MYVVPHPYCTLYCILLGLLYCSLHDLTRCIRHTGNDNLSPGAQELANAYKNAGSPKQVRGFATNVAGWNSWDQTPGEFSSSSDAQYNKCQNEKIYVDTFAPLLSQNGMPNHAIVDTGRNGVTGLRIEWGDWCNCRVRTPS